MSPAYLCLISTGTAAAAAAGGGGEGEGGGGVRRRRHKNQCLPVLRRHHVTSRVGEPSTRVDQEGKCVRRPLARTVSATVFAFLSLSLFTSCFLCCHAAAPSLFLAPSLLIGPLRFCYLSFVRLCFFYFLCYLFRGQSFRLCVCVAVSVSVFCLRVGSMN